MSARIPEEARGKGSALTFPALQFVVSRSEDGVREGVGPAGSYGRRGHAGTGGAYGPSPVLEGAESIGGGPGR
jgi:hypothetical protein